MCTSIKLKKENEIILGQNYDFYYGHGLIVVNKRVLLKAALTNNSTKDNLFTDENNGVKWKSKYGSVTFNQFGRELPTCGMNEVGLSIASMWHDIKVNPMIDTDKPSISELQWIQMQLDLYETIDEVELGLNDYAYSVSMYPMHYHIVDHTGNSAIVELKHGKLKMYKQMGISACSNAGILDSLAYAKKRAFEKPEDITLVEPILDRAAKAILLSNAFNAGLLKEDISKKAFEILDYVSLNVGFSDLFRWIGKGVPPSQTFLQILFDVSNKKIVFKSMAKKNRTFKEIAFKDIDFSASEPVLVFDVEKPVSGSILSHMNHYTTAANAEIVKKTYAPVKKEFPPDAQEEIIRFPEFYLMES